MQSDDADAMDTIGRPEPAHQEGQHAGQAEAVVEHGEQRAEPRRKRGKRGANRKRRGKKSSKSQAAWRQIGEVGRGIVPAEPNKGGRPSLYSPQLADAILAAILAGATIPTICNTEGFPSRVTLNAWKATNEEFRNQFEAAIAARNENILEDCLHLGQMCEGLPSTMAGGFKVSIETKFRVLEHLERSKRLVAAKEEPKPEDAKVIDGEVKRLDSDPLYQAFQAFEEATKAAK